MTIGNLICRSTDVAYRCAEIRRAGNGTEQRESQFSFESVQDSLTGYDDSSHLFRPSPSSTIFLFCPGGAGEDDPVFGERERA